MVTTSRSAADPTSEPSSAPTASRTDGLRTDGLRTDGHRADAVEPTPSEPTVDPPVGPGPEVVAGQFMAAVVAVDLAEAFIDQEFLEPSAATPTTTEVFEERDLRGRRLIGGTDARRSRWRCVLYRGRRAAGELPMPSPLPRAEDRPGWRVDDLTEPSWADRDDADKPTSALVALDDERPRATSPTHPEQQRTRFPTP